MEKAHEITMAVRDYELDLQGIVNNSVYLNYLEHARHLCIKELKLDFNALHQEGIDPVVVRVEMDYRQSLRSGDEFLVRTMIRPHGRFRHEFHQEILRLPSRDSCLKATVTAAILKDGRPQAWPDLQERWNHWTSLE